MFWFQRQRRSNIERTPLSCKNATSQQLHPGTGAAWPLRCFGSKGNGAATSNERLRAARTPRHSNSTPALVLLGRFDVLVPKATAQQHRTNTSELQESHVTATSSQCWCCLAALMFWFQRQRRNNIERTPPSCKNATSQQPHPGAGAAWPLRCFGSKGNGAATSNEHLRAARKPRHSNFIPVLVLLGRFDVLVPKATAQQHRTNASELQERHVTATPPRHWCCLAASMFWFQRQRRSNIERTPPSCKNATSQQLHPGAGAA
ncbi:hypothetical protein Y032_0041g342 [Ancylostoma ceylanicum]|uniref:Uncharacterized protein n=1 Tax=Ancylostoma ceylanicum TaxID=53326 RepID=A0A016UHN7_9BILA|nr:hypothetical protein Y032_0041g342 [Ancylostoma ceylanicum]